MRYITTNQTETGKKFKELLELAYEHRKTIYEFVENCPDLKNIHEIFFADFYLVGGIIGFSFKTEPDKKLWRRHSKWKKIFILRKNKQTKLLQDQIDNLPTISRDELNKIIGFSRWDPESRGCNAGFIHKDDFSTIGFMIKDDWKIKMTDDCTEITVAEWNKIFEKEDDNNI